MALDNATYCQDENKPISVNFNGNAPSIGEVWNTSNINDDRPYCVTITTGVTEVTSTKLLTTQYTDCYDCMSNNYGIVLVTDCIGSKNYSLTLESFGFLPTIGATYYLTFLISSPGKSNLITTCVTVNKEGIRQLTENEYNDGVAYRKIGVVQIGPTLETNCQDCLSGNSLSYEVQRCTDSETDYVLLINDSFINHVIAYSDGVTEYCGTVVGLGTGGVPFTFINDYGLGGDGGSATCDQCLATEGLKVLLRSCTDEEYTEVVWAASLFDSGDISNLSTENGCFIVEGPIEDAEVTLNSYLNFDPQPGCEPCIECNGINYSYTTCSGEVSGDFKSYQYLSGGTTFYHPAIGECCEVVGTSSSYYDTLYSVETFEDCPDCENNVDVVIWNASACTNSNTYSSFYVTTDSTAQIGDVVKLMWGSNEWICAGLINTVSSYSGYYTYYNTQKNGLGSTLIYDSCENCNSQGLIGVTLVNCDTLVESFVSITLDNYLSIYNFGSLTNYSVKGSNGSCYQITNLCPIPLEGQGFTAVEFYFNCTFCESSDVNPPRSANTEYNECRICCECGATGSTVNVISPPHPVWTDGYGTPVTQLNMVTLGGMKGLNS
jgi:hypothetical protein